MVKNVLNIKVLREIRYHFKTYLSVIFIATLAVTLFTGIWANYKNFNDRLNHIYQEANMCDGIVMVNEYDERIEAILSEQADYYEKRIYLPAKNENNNVYLATFNNQSNLNLPFTSSVDKLDASMVLVDQNFLTRNQLEIGSRIQLELPFNNQKLILELEISGVMTHPESLENSVYNPAFIFVGEEALTNAMPFPVQLNQLYNQYLIKGSNMDDIQKELENFDTLIYALKRSDLPSNRTIDADVNQAKMLIYIFPVLFYLVAVLIILTSISQLIQKEGKNIGILKALGFQKGEILFHYMKIFILLGMIGSLLGIILGPLIVPSVMNQKYQILYQLPSISLPFFRWEYLISVGILILIIVLVSLFACFGAMNKVPASSLRGDNAVKMELSFLSRFHFIQKIPLSILMAVRNMKRKVSRTLMVLLGVMGCSALLVCGFGIEDTIEYGLDLELESLIPYDLTVTYSENSSKLNEMEKIAGVQQIDEYAKSSVHVEKDTLIASYLYLLPENPAIFQISYDQDDCILSTKVAEDIGAKKGDTIHFIYENKQYEKRVTQIVDFCLSQGIFMRYDSIPVDFNPTGAWIRSADGIAHAKIEEEMKQLHGIQSVITIEDMRIRAEDTISSIKVMTWTIKIFAILLAVVVLYNLALLNFKERIKDIATLKVLGFSRFEVASSLMIEIIVLTFISSLVGLALGYPLLYAVLSINENPLLTYIYHIRPSSYLWTVLITCGSSLFINFIFAWLTNKVQMVESLKSVE